MVVSFFQSIVQNSKTFILVSQKSLAFCVLKNRTASLALYPFTKINFLSSFLPRNKSIVANSFFLSFSLNKLIKFKNSKIWFFELELIGLGYKITVKNNIIRLNLGFSHLIFTILPFSVFLIKKKSKIMLFSLNKLELSELVARLLRFKPLNPFKLKGIKRKDLVFKLKPGKRTK